MPPTVEVRLCAEQDLAEVASLYRAWQEEGSVWGLVSEPAGRLRERMGEFFLVACSGGRIVGFAIAKIDRQPFCIFPDGKPYLEIEDVYVSPAARGQGAGTALMETLISAAKAAGIDGFHLYSAGKHPDRASKFYERFGFRVWSIQMYRK